MSSELSFAELTIEVNLWANANFGLKQEPWLGMLEELGELAHCSLKRIQGIRGFDDYSFYHDHFRDAIGDIGVYAANYAYNHNLVVEWPQPSDGQESTSVMECYGFAAYWLSLLAVPDSMQRIRFWRFLSYVDAIARKEMLTLSGATNQTWEAVRQRDWVKDKQGGG